MRREEKDEEWKEEEEGDEETERRKRRKEKKRIGGEAGRREVTFARFVLWKLSIQLIVWEKVFMSREQKKLNEEKKGKKRTKNEGEGRTKQHIVAPSQENETEKKREEE